MQESKCLTICTNDSHQRICNQSMIYSEFTRDTDVGLHRGITIGNVIAKLFAMILNQRIQLQVATWTEKHAVKANDQDFCRTDNIFIPRSLIEKQRQTQLIGNAGKLFLHGPQKSVQYCTSCCAVAGAGGLSWTSSSLCMHTTAQQYGHCKHICHLQMPHGSEA